MIQNNLKRPSYVESSKVSTKDVVFGRVVDIVLDESHPDYSLFGESKALYGIRYRDIEQPFNEQEVESLPFAFLYDSFSKELPLIDEIVQVFPAPSFSLTGSIKYINYYSKVVNVWNNPNHSAIPTSQQPSLAEGASESENSRPLTPNPGDYILQGRLGNSIRLGGYNKEGQKKPFVYIRNTLEKPTERNQVEEAPNSDDAFIALTSNKSLDLTSFNSPKKTFKINPNEEQEPTPKNFETFEGKQILGKSDRVSFLAEQDAFFESREVVGVSGRRVHIDGTKDIKIDAPKIYLGERSITSEDKQPGVKGLELEHRLHTILNLLEEMARHFQAANTPAAASAILTKLGSSLLPKIKFIESRVERIKSKKVFIE